MFDLLPPSLAPADFDSQRDHLLRAVAEVIATRGYDHTDVLDIAAHADVTPGTFRTYFDDKQDAVLAAFDAFVDRLAEYNAIAIAHIRPATAKDEARVRIAALLAVAHAEPSLGRLAFLHMHEAGSAAVERYEHALVTFGLQAPELIVSGLVGLVADTIRSDGATSLSECCEQLTALTIDACRSLRRSC